MLILFPIEESEELNVDTNSEGPVELEWDVDFDDKAADEDGQMKNFLMKSILFSTLLMPFLFSAQESTYVSIVDTNLYLHESERNYLGINLSPMVAGLLNNLNDHDIKNLRYIKEILEILI